MYVQKEKPKENKSRAVANSVGQKKSNVKQGFEFVDNRPEVIAQRKLQAHTYVQGTDIHLGTMQPIKNYDYNGKFVLGRGEARYADTKPNEERGETNNSTSVQRKVYINGMNDDEAMDDMGDFVNPRWNFSADQKTRYRIWVRDPLIRQFAGIATLRAALTAEIAAQTYRDTQIAAYGALAPEAQTGTTAAKAAAVMALAVGSSGTAYSWGAANHQAQWVTAEWADQMSAQAAFAQMFGGWAQGPGLYMSSPPNLISTVGWVKDDMVDPNLMKITLNNVPTIDLTNAAVVKVLSAIEDPTGTALGSHKWKAQNLMYKTNLPVRMIYGTASRLSTKVGVTLNTDMKSFLTKAEVDAMIVAAATRPNALATLQTLRREYP